MMIRGFAKKISPSAVGRDRFEIIGPFPAGCADAAGTVFVPPAAPGFGDQRRQVRKALAFATKELVLLEEWHEHADLRFGRLAAARHAGNRIEEFQEFRRRIAEDDTVGTCVAGG